MSAAQIFKRPQARAFDELVADTGAVIRSQLTTMKLLIL